MRLHDNMHLASAPTRRSWANSKGAVIIGTTSDVYSNDSYGKNKRLRLAKPGFCIKTNGHRLLAWSRVERNNRTGRLKVRSSTVLGAFVCIGRLVVMQGDSMCDHAGSCNHISAGAFALGLPGVMDRSYSGNYTLTISCIAMKSPSY